MTVAQADRQASARTIAGTDTTHNGDMRAMFEAEATITAGTTYNGAFIAWLKERTGSSGDNLPGLMAEFAADEGAHNWSSVGTFEGNVIAQFEPVAWYEFTDGSGTQLTDRSGNARHGTLGSTTATPTWTAEGLSFDGGDFVSVSPAIPIVQGIDIVFKPSVAYNAASSREAILATVGVNAVESGVHFGSVTGAITNEILTVVQQADGDGFAANGRRAWTHATDTLTADWHLLQIDWLGGTPYFNIVLDGTDVANALVLTLEPWMSAIWRIGREITGPPGFVGSIAYLVFYPTGRSTQQQADAADFLAEALAPRGIVWGDL